MEITKFAYVYCRFILFHCLRVKVIINLKRPALVMLHESRPLLLARAASGSCGLCAVTTRACRQRIGRGNGPVRDLGAMMVQPHRSLAKISLPFSYMLFMIYVSPFFFPFM
jgi:hypothetical protein